MRFQRLFACFAVIQLALSASVFATEIYIYERADGSRLITDHARIEPGYQLVKVYPAAADESPSYTGSNSLSTRRTTEYDELIERVSNAVTLDPALIKSVMQAESAFNPQALSKKGAQGLMQLMPGTARRYGVTQILDPQQNVLAGSRYLRDLMRQFDGDVRLALAGYNAGENAVLKYGGIPPFAETQHYVQKVLQLYKAYRNLDCENAPSGVKVISCSATKPKNTAWITSMN